MSKPASDDDDTEINPGNDHLRDASADDEHDTTDASRALTVTGEQPDDTPPPLGIATGTNES